LWASLIEQQGRFWARAISSLFNKLQPIEVGAGGCV